MHDQLDTLPIAECCLRRCRGHPQDTATRHLWPQYAAAILSSRAAPADLVMVDGRFRVSCLLHALLVANENTTILLHDFWPRTRMGYGIVLQFVDVVDGVDSFAVVKKKRNLSDDVINMHIPIYQYDPR